MHYLEYEFIMKELKNKIGFFYKYLSSKFYLTEIPVENKKTVLLHWSFWRSHAKDAIKIIRTGSCITLLSDFVPIEAKTFFRLLFFEDYAKYVFWTFNDNFLIDLSGNVLLIDNDNIDSCIKILRLYPVAYDQKLNTGVDEEISYCYRKIASLKKDKKFDKMFGLDLQNRKIVLELLEKRLVTNGKGENDKNGLCPIEPDPAINQPREISFLDMVNPTNGSIENTLSYIETKIIEANFPHNIFHTIKKTKKGINQAGLNSEIAAMVNVFQVKGYFKKGFTFKEIYKSFGIYTKNKSGKDYDYSFFVEDYNFKKYLQNLKSLEINTLNLAS
ncbi:MAG: hypothetical protein M3R50_02425 [Bacteroidota bacterium]|nr:hypothetical protein [Bacteroidota bacterium]